MMSKLLSGIIFFLSGASTFAQLTLDRQVISCFAFNASQDFSIQSTAGQIDYSCSEGNALNLTAGFEQPNEAVSIALNITVVYNACSETFDAEVTHIGGCAENEAVRFFWNGVEGQNKQTHLDRYTMLEVQTANGCSFSSEYDFQSMSYETNECGLVFYTYLSPNGDGDNDFWKIENITSDRYAKNEVSFFNRWGGLIWHSSNYDNVQNVWSGKTTEGEILPDGTYFYVVKADEQEYTGYVEVMR